MELRFQEKIFHSKRMPFYMFGMFGDTIYLGKIPEADWVSYIYMLQIQQSRYHHFRRAR